MKLLSLTLAACLLAGYVQAQTPAQNPPPAETPATAPASSSSHHDSCKKEVHKLCGHAHGQEMKDCIKSGLDMNKFSSDCASKLAAKAGAAK